jgi:hypothetical protein
MFESVCMVSVIANYFEEKGHLVVPWNSGIRLTDFNSVRIFDKNLRFSFEILSLLGKNTIESEATYESLIKYPHIILFQNKHFLDNQEIVIKNPTSSKISPISINNPDMFEQIENLMDQTYATNWRDSSLFALGHC